jgi:hypothetical protein
MRRTNPLLNSHTHLQATQVLALAKAYRTVCLPDRTSDKKALGGNSTY